MASGTRIIDYLGSGTHAARPSTPPVPTGGTAIYYETDTTNTFIWIGASWTQINGGGGGGATGTTFDGYTVASGLGTDRLGRKLAGRAGPAGAGATGWISGMANASGANVRSTGKFYYEFLIGEVVGSGGASLGIGFGQTAMPLGNYVGNDVNGWSDISGASGIYHNGSSIVSSSAFVSGDVIGIAVDFTASTGSLKFYKNNVLDATVSSLTLTAGGPAASMQIARGGGYVTLNTSAAQCTYSPPATYSNWD